MNELLKGKITKMLSEEKSFREIAEKLHVSFSTIEQVNKEKMENKEEKNYGEVAANFFWLRDHDYDILQIVRILKIDPKLAEKLSSEYDRLFNKEVERHLEFYKKYIAEKEE